MRKHKHQHFNSWKKSIGTCENFSLFLLFSHQILKVTFPIRTNKIDTKTREWFPRGTLCFNVLQEPELSSTVKYRSYYTSPPSIPDENKLDSRAWWWSLKDSDHESTVYRIFVLGRKREMALHLQTHSSWSCFNLSQDKFSRLLPFFCVSCRLWLTIFWRHLDLINKR